MGAPRSVAFASPYSRTFFGGVRGSALRGLGFDLPQIPGVNTPGGVLDQAGQAAKDAEDAARKAAQDAEDKARSQYQQAQDAISSVQDLINHPDKLVKSISIYTTHGPDLRIDDPLKPTPPGVGSQVTRALKPKMVIAFNPIAGQQLKPVSYAPYGEPGPTDFDTWVTVAAVAGGLGVGIVALGAASFFKGRKGGLLRRWLAARKARKSGMALAGVRRSKRARAKRTA